MSANGPQRPEKIEKLVTDLATLCKHAYNNNLNLKLEYDSLNAFEWWLVDFEKYYTEFLEKKEPNLCFSVETKYLHGESLLNQFENDLKIRKESTRELNKVIDHLKEDLATIKDSLKLKS